VAVGGRWIPRAELDAMVERAMRSVGGYVTDPPGSD
jgi:hypothetical protein